MADLFENPMGLAGFEFVEFTAPERGILEPVFESIGMTRIARHRTKDVDLWRQGGINMLVNYEPNCHAAYYGAEHGPSACAMGFRVKDATAAFELAVSKGAEPVEVPSGFGELRLPAIKGIGGAIVYLIDRMRKACPSTTSTSLLGGCGSQSRRLWFQYHRSLDPQRLQRPYGLLGVLLRAAVQLP